MTLKQCFSTSARSVLYTWGVSLLVFALLGALLQEFDDSIVSIDHTNHYDSARGYFAVMTFVVFLMWGMYTLIPAVLVAVVRFFVCASGGLTPRWFLAEFLLTVGITLIVSRLTGGWKQVADLFPASLGYLLPYVAGMLVTPGALPRKAKTA